MIFIKGCQPAWNESETLNTLWAMPPYLNFYLHLDFDINRGCIEDGPRFFVTNMHRGGILVLGCCLSVLFIIYLWTNLWMNSEFLVCESLKLYIIALSSKIFQYLGTNEIFCINETCQYSSFHIFFSLPFIEFWCHST